MKVLIIGADNLGKTTLEAAIQSVNKEAEVVVVNDNPFSRPPDMHISNEVYNMDELKFTDNYKTGQENRRERRKKERLKKRKS